MIKGRLRLLARLLNESRNITNSIKNFSDLFTPSNYDFLIPAINMIGKYNENPKMKNLYATPAAAAAAGAYVNELSDIWIAPVTASVAQLA